MTTTKTFPAQLPIRTQIEMFKDNDVLALAIQLIEERAPDNVQETKGYLTALVDFVHETLGSRGPSEIVVRHLITRRPICNICDENLADSEVEVIFEDDIAPRRMVGCEECIVHGRDGVHIYEMRAL